MRTDTNGTPDFSGAVLSTRSSLGYGKLEVDVHAGLVADGWDETEAHFIIRAAIIMDAPASPEV